MRATERARKFSMKNSPDTTLSGGQLEWRPWIYKNRRIGLGFGYSLGKDCEFPPLLFDREDDRNFRIDRILETEVQTETYPAQSPFLLEDCFAAMKGSC